MNKVLGTALSFFLVLSIVATPKPLVSTGDSFNYGAKPFQLTSINYPTEPPDPMEWFSSKSVTRSVPRYSAPRYAVAAPVIMPNAPQVNPTVPMTKTDTPPKIITAIENSTDWDQIKQEIDQKKEEILSKREDKFARIKENVEKFQQDIRNRTLIPDTPGNLP